MAKWQIDAMLDAGLAYITGNAIEIYVCNAQPTTYAEASATFALTDVAVPSFTGPANGDGGGRKITVDEEADVDVNTTDDATHVALCSATVLLYVTTCTLQGLTSGNTVTIPAWDIEIDDAA